MFKFTKSASNKWTKIKSISNKLYENEYMANEKAKYLFEDVVFRTRHLDNDTKIDINQWTNYYNINEKTSFYGDREQLYGYLLNHNIAENQIINIKKFDKLNKEKQLYELLLSITCDNLSHGQYSHTGYMSINNENTIEHITKICKSINAKHADILQDEFVTNTTHSNGDTAIYIEKLMDKHNILQEELFYYMAKFNGPFNMGVFDHKEENIITNINQAKQILESRNYYIDYYNGIAMKNRFAKDENGRQWMHISKFDDRNSYSFYYCVIYLLNTKINYNK